MQVIVTLKARYAHSLTAFNLGPGLTWVVEFEATQESWTESAETQPTMADTTLLQFRECAHNYITIYTQIIVQML